MLRAKGCFGECFGLIQDYKALCTYLVYILALKGFMKKRYGSIKVHASQTKRALRKTSDACSFLAEFPPTERVNMRMEGQGSVRCRTSFSDDNLTSDTSNRRARFGSDAKEQLSLTDEGCASADDMQFASVEDC